MVGDDIEITIPRIPSPDAVPQAARRPRARLLAFTRPDDPTGPTLPEVTWRPLKLILVLGVGAVWFLGGMTALSVDRLAGSFSCPIPHADSASGYSTWSWLPPGNVCHFPDGSTTRPNRRGELVAEGAFVVGVALIGYGFRRTRFDRAELLEKSN